MAIEKLLGLETPEKATWMRMCLSELNRIHSHLVWLGTSALELGAISMFWYAFRERDLVLDLFEMVTGVRMHGRYFQVGGLAEDVPRASTPRRASSRGTCRRRSTTTRGSSTGTRSGWSGRRASVRSRPRTRSRSVSPAPCSEHPASTGTCKNMPYLAYDEVDFDVPVYPNGDVYDRTRCTWTRCAPRRASSASA